MRLSSSDRRRAAGVTMAASMDWDPAVVPIVFASTPVGAPPRVFFHKKKQLFPAKYPVPIPPKIEMHQQNHRKRGAAGRWGAGWPGEAGFTMVLKTGSKEKKRKKKEVFSQKLEQAKTHALKAKAAKERVSNNNNNDDDDDDDDDDNDSRGRRFGF